MCLQLPSYTVCYSLCPAPLQIDYSNDFRKSTSIVVVAAKTEENLVAMETVLCNWLICSSEKSWCKPDLIGCNWLWGCKSLRPFIAHVYLSISSVDREFNINAIYNCATINL